MIPVMPKNDNKKTSKNTDLRESLNLVAPAGSNQPPSNSLERGLRMIEMIASSKNGLSNKEISEELCIAGPVGTRRVLFAECCHRPVPSRSKSPGDIARCTEAHEFPGGRRTGPSTAAR